MKLLFTFIISFTLSISVIGQTSSPENTKPFGSSLENYKTKKQKLADKQKNEEPDDVIQVKTNLVVNNVLVTDQSGIIVKGLTKDDFLVTEDGAPQIIEMFSFGETTSAPRSIVLIIDTGIAQLPYLKNSRGSVKSCGNRKKTKIAYPCFD